MSALSGISLRSPPAQLTKEQLKMKAAQQAAAATESYEDDADEGNHLSKEEERERKKMMQAKIRKEQAEGPPPDMSKRALIFDSMSKIISRTFGKGASRAGVAGETRGTYIFTWGAGYHGQLGRQFERGRKKYATIPKMVHLDIAIRQIACGGLHTAAVTDAGTVYTWGDARAHQLGYQPHGFTNQPVPHLVESLDGVAFVVSVACGQSHTVCLTDKGSLISFGSSKMGQCGHGDRQAVKAPRKIRLDDPTIKFSEVSCGDKHTAALTTKGTVWAFGSCQQGQGGFDESPPVDKLKPTEVKALSDAGVIVSSVVCGSIHTCMVTDEGALYICGFGEHFYPNEEQNFFYRPVQVPFHEKIVQVACGQSHIIALTANSDVYTFGSGLYGQLGQGVKGDLNTPRLILTGKNIAQVAAGRYHSVALTSFGTVYTWGSGENGQLGHLSDENVLFPKVLEPNLGTVVGQIACGEHHTAVLTSTPWAAADPEVIEWLRCEQEEYNLKLKYIRRSNHGLVKKDLLKIQERMHHLKEEWAAAKTRGQMREEQELQGHVESVKARNQILADMAEEQRAREERQAAGGVWPPTQAQQANARNAYSMDGAEAKESGYDRPDSASRPLQARMGSTISGAQTARPAPISMGSTNFSRTAGAGATMAPRRPLAASPLTARGSLDSPSSGLMNLTGGADVVGSNAARCNFLRESAGMVRRMKGIIAESGEASTDDRLKKTIGAVFAFRKDYDTLRNLTRKRMRILEAIQRKVSGLRKNNDSTKNRRKINELLLKALKMKLSTVTIKITETEENRRNYALNIAHLKEEELDRYFQLEALRKQHQDNENFIRKIADMKMAGLEESAKSEQELAEFRAEIQGFHAFITDQLEKFQAISALAAQRKEKREAEKIARNAKSHEKINARISKLTSELDEKSKESLAMASQLESVNERLRYFEKRFQQIASATGLTNPDAIINKFSLKEEIRTELSTEIKAKTELLGQMQADLARNQSELDQARANFQESKWKDVDALYKLVHDSQANASHHTTECERLDEKLAYYKEGMLALLTMIPLELMAPAPGAGGNPEEGRALLQALEGADIGHERTMQLIQVLGDKLLGLSDLVSEGEAARVQRLRDAEEMKRAQEAATQARLAQEIAEKLKMSSMMRRTAPKSQHAAYSAMDPAHGGGGDLDDEEDEEGLDEQEEEDDGESAGEEDMQRTQQRQGIPAYGEQQQYQYQ